MLAKNKILITGAAGFIGSHLVDKLIKDGTPKEQLRLLIAPWDTLDNLSHHHDLEIHRIDIRDKNKLVSVVSGCSVVYHLAAKIDFLGKNYKEYEEVNVLPTKWLYLAAKKNNVKKFIFFSSIGVHGLPAGIGTIENWDESHAASYTNDYGKSKWMAEEVIRSLYKQLRIPYAIIHPASVYGPREKGPTLALFKAIQHKQFVLIGSGDNLLHYVYVGDIVSAAITAAESALDSGEYIIGGPEPVSLKSVANTIAAICDVRIWPLQIPTALALPLSAVVESLSKLFGIAPLLYPERVRTMTTTYYFNIQKAKNELGFYPAIPFSLGARVTGTWYKIKGWL